jgi:hypothetical protein
MPQSYLTQDDVNDYGTDLVNFAQRAAAHALSPQIERIEQQNRDLQYRLGIEARARLDAAVEKAVPDFREIDRDKRWHRWLSSPDPLSGRIRQEWLNDAIRTGATNRVIRFFQEFKQQAAGQGASQSYGQASLSGKAIYTRPQIQALYDQHRKGLWAGRESEWARIDADIIRAAGEGRILNPDRVTK